MKIVTRPTALRHERRPLCLAAGFFDGVHEGHQRVIRAAVACARAHGGRSWVMTFDIHPLKVLRPHLAPLLLTSTAHKLALLESLGLDGCLLLRFTPHLAAMEPEAFLAQLWRAAPGLHTIFVGPNWRFGRGGRGDVALLQRRAQAQGIGVVSVPPVRRAGRAVSSTRIRQAVEQGRLEAAAAMLGRPFSLLGTVVSGRRIGRTLGFPTANLRPHNEVRPPFGIYAVHALVRGAVCAGVLSYGVRPTIGPGLPPLMELHLLNGRRNLYRATVEVFFRVRLRAERKFRSRAALAAQIARDSAQARRILGAYKAKKLWKKALQARSPHIIVPRK